MWGIDRQAGFNVIIITFWTITAIELAILAKTLPLDQEQMLQELTTYADSKIALAEGYGSINAGEDNHSEQSEALCSENKADDDTIYSIETLTTSFDANAARSTLKFIESSLTETGSLICSPSYVEKSRSKMPVLDSLVE